MDKRPPSQPGSIQDTPPPWLTVGLGLLTLWVLLYPFEFNREPVTKWLSGVWIGKIDAVTNVLLFIPFGIAVGWAKTRSTTKGSLVAPVVTAVVIGTCISLIAETVQVWLIERQSSVIDLIANTTGTMFGALVGRHGANRLSEAWLSLQKWLSTRPIAQKALALIAVAMVFRTWPFDLWPEKFYLRMELFESLRTGLPFPNWRHWQAGTGLGYDAVMELGAASITFMIFAAISFAIGRAIYECASKHGDRYQPVGSILFVAGGLAIATELLQWPIRSRTMDLTDLTAAIGGVVTGVVLDWLLRLRSPSLTEMQLSDLADRAAARRTLLRVSLLLFGALLYISVVPLKPISVPLDEAIVKFKHQMFDVDLRRGGRVDFPLNAMAFGALAFVTMGALGTITRSRGAWLILNAVVWVTVVAMGAGMEFAQIFLPPRQPNAMDVIAQGVGAAGALILWWLGGIRLLEPVAKAFSLRGPELIRPLLQVYLAAYIFYAVMPLDFVLSPGEFRGKLANNQIQILPFTSYLFKMPFSEWWMLVRDVVLTIPLGALVALPSKYGKKIKHPLFVSMMFFAAIETFQLILLSRVSATQDILINTLGVWIGMWLIRVWPSLNTWTPKQCAKAAGVYALALLCLNALPYHFDFSRLNHTTISEYLHHIPFAPLHFSPPFPALDDVTFSMLLALPLGIFLRAWQLRSASALAKSWAGPLGALVLIMGWYALIGVIQLALPARDPEMTEAVSALFGAWAGMAFTSRVMDNNGVRVQST